VHGAVKPAIPALFIPVYAPQSFLFFLLCMACERIFLPLVHPRHEDSNYFRTGFPLPIKNKPLMNKL